MRSVAAFFDNEEVGSASTPGAASTFLRDVLARMVPAPSLPRAITRSMLVSLDMAHAVHPNYEEKHEAKHRPEMHKGAVIKHNCNQR